MKAKLNKQKDEAVRETKNKTTVCCLQHHLRKTLSLPVSNSETVALCIM